MSIQVASPVDVSVSPSLPPVDSRQRVKQFVQELQDSICQGLEAMDGKAQ
jgi:coproporphyrinogen III oxidase